MLHAYEVADAVADRHIEATRTQWLDSRVTLPKYPGWYEVCSTVGGFIYFRYWDCKKWKICDAAHHYCAWNSAIQEYQWRGLAEKPV